MDRPPVPMNSKASLGTLPSLAAQSAVATCPRCRGDLAVLRPQSRRVRGIMAHLCSSLSCGYKLIVPM